MRYTLYPSLHLAFSGIRKLKPSEPTTAPIVTIDQVLDTISSDSSGSLGLWALLRDPDRLRPYVRAYKMKTNSHKTFHCRIQPDPNTIGCRQLTIELYETVSPKKNSSQKTDVMTETITLTFQYQQDGSPVLYGKPILSIYHKAKAPNNQDETKETLKTLFEKFLANT